MDDVNPYNEPLDNIYHIFNRLSLDTRVKDNEFEEINLFEVNKLIDEINEKIIILSMFVKILLKKNMKMMKRLFY